MKLAILAAFLFVAAVAALPVEQPDVKVVAVEPAPEQSQDDLGAEDLKPEESHWGGWGGGHYYRPIHYGGWGGSYYRPYYGGWRGYGWGGYPSYGWGRSYWG